MRNRALNEKGVCEKALSLKKLSLGTKLTNKELYEKLAPSTQEAFNNIRADIKEKYKEILFLITIAIISLLLIFYFKPVSEPMKIWFQRSGSIIVIVCVIIEIKITEIESIAISKSHPFLHINILLKNIYSNKIRIANIVNILFIVIGTAIWGYGDIFFT